MKLQLTAHGAFKQLLFCIHQGSDLLCSLSLCAKSSPLQIFCFHPRSQPFKMCISQYLALWAKEVFVKFERWSEKVFCVERTQQTFSAQASGTEFCSSWVCLVTQESNNKIRQQRLHGKLEHTLLGLLWWFRWKQDFFMCLQRIAWLRLWTATIMRVLHVTKQSFVLKPRSNCCYLTCSSVLEVTIP